MQPKRFPIITWIGYRGAGKSTLASLLAKQTGLPLYATDTLIAKAAGASAETLATHIVEKGWPWFRHHERTVIADLISQFESISHKHGGAILDCGGGAVEHMDLMKKLQTHTLIVYLEAPVDMLLAYLKRQPRPPLLTGLSLEEETEKKLAMRLPLYEEYAHITLERTVTKEKFAQAYISPHVMMLETLRKKLSNHEDFRGISKVFKISDAHSPQRLSKDTAIRAVKT